MEISEVHLLTNSISETESFYEGKLGFDLVENTDELLCFEVGVSKFYFHLPDTIQKRIYHFAFDIPENKLLEALEWIREKVELIPFEGHEIIDFSNWNAKSFYFYDNNGNILECIIRYDLFNVSNDAFDSDSFLKISEIGFAVDDVYKFCDEINSKCQTDYFERQPRREIFSVLGNNSGLFIVSAKSRNWFPTNHVATSFWTKVVFRNDEVDYAFTYNP